MNQQIKVWFDAEGDFLEVIFVDAPGYLRSTDHDAVMERVDENGNLLGFSIFGVAQYARQNPLVAQLTAQAL